MNDMPKKPISGPRTFPSANGYPKAGVGDPSRRRQIHGDFNGITPGERTEAIESLAKGLKTLGGGLTWIACAQIVKAVLRYKAR